MIIKPIFVDLIGPMIPFISWFWLVRNETEVECGGVKEYELSIVNYSFLILVNVG